MASNKRRLLNFFILAIILGVILIQFTQTIGLAARGFDSEEVLKQYFFYVAPGVGALLIIFMIFMWEHMRNEGDSKYGNSIAFASQGENPSLPFFKRFTTPQLALLSAILFSFSGLFATLTNQESFTGITLLPQQFTASSSILFSTALVVVSENLGAALTIAFLFLILRHYSRKFNLSSTNFKIIALSLFGLVVGVVGLANHLLRYSSSEIAKTVVFFFWAIGGYITVITGSFIPFAMMHASNNIFIDLRRFFSSDTLIIYIVGVIFGLVLIYLLIYRKRLLGRTS